MNATLLNRRFEMPADGWYQLAPLGEFPHAKGLQVIDQAAAMAIVERFGNRRTQEGDRFSGVLIDFDHFSLDSGKSSEAAGWIENMEARESGVWGRIRWTDKGEAAVKGGNYRFISPVWWENACEKLEDGRLRPLEIGRAAVTNDPNLRGIEPLSNRFGASAGPIGKSAMENPAPGAVKETDDMKTILAALELPEGSDEQVAVGAIEALKNSRSAAEDRALTVEKQLLTADVEGDLDRYAPVIANREEVKARLLENREGTLKVLAAMKPPEKPVEKPPAEDPVPNRKNLKTPADGGQADDEAESARATAIRNRAHEIMRHERVTYSQAFSRAEREHRSL